MRAWLVVVIVLALAAPAPASAEDAHGSVSLVGGVFGRLGGASGEPGGALVLSRSLAMGADHGFFQLRSDTHLLLGATSARTFHGLVALTVGADLYPLPWFSFDLKIGVAGGVELRGSVPSPTYGFYGTGAVALHPWDDRGRRIFVVTNATSLVTSGVDSGGDCLFCGGLKSLGVGYETTF